MRRFTMRRERDVSGVSEDGERLEPADLVVLPRR